MGRRMDALNRILQSNDAVSQYRAELSKVMGEVLQQNRKGEAEQRAEKCYSDFRRKVLADELKGILSEFAGKEPSTQPTKSNDRIRLEGWDAEKVARSGSVRTANPPALIAHEVLSPEATNSRIKGDKRLKNDLASILAQLDVEAAEVERKKGIAKALLVAAEFQDARGPVKISWVKVNPIKAGCLPARINDLKGYSGRYPPESNQEKQAIAKHFPAYAEWLKLPDELEAPQLEDSMVGWYEKAEDPLAREHKRLMDEWRRKAAFNHPEDRWELVTQDMIQEAANVAEKEVF
jgi:hypothetical protein